MQYPNHSPYSEQRNTIQAVTGRSEAVYFSLVFRKRILASTIGGGLGTFHVSKGFGAPNVDHGEMLRKSVGGDVDCFESACACSM